MSVAAIEGFGSMMWGYLLEQRENKVFSRILDVDESRKRKTFIFKKVKIFRIPSLLLQGQKVCKVYNGQHLLDYTFRMENFHEVIIS